MVQPVRITNSMGAGDYGASLESIEDDIALIKADIAAIRAILES